MSGRNTTTHWGSVSQFLHWLVAGLILIQIGLGVTGKLLPRGPGLLTLIRSHKSLGITILAIAVIRLVWRWLNPVPVLPHTIPSYERGIARLTHALLYVVLFAMPLTGWIGSAAHGTPVQWFGLFQVPSPVGKDKALSALMNQTHLYLAIFLGVVLVLHIAAALRHHFVLRDDTLQRMLPAGKPAADTVR
ncbi:MAG: cytochrome b [Steroidobacteraceae bacterium]